MDEKDYSKHKKLRVLIVEDHAALAENLYEFLSEDKYILDFAPDGLTGLHLAATNHYDVIVLDVMLPGIDGFTLCRRLRDDIRSDVPIVMLTAKSAMEDKETGFDRGADDYITKPFEMRELELRIGALSRRNALKRSDLHAGDYRFTPGTLEVGSADGRTTKLTGIGANIFEMLMRAYPDYVSHQALVESIWPDQDVDLHTLRSHISALRKQLKNGVGNSLIDAVHGKGYCLNVDTGNNS